MDKIPSTSNANTPIAGDNFLEKPKIETRTRSNSLSVIGGKINGRFRSLSVSFQKIFSKRSTPLPLAEKSIRTRSVSAPTPLKQRANEKPEGTLEGIRYQLKALTTECKDAIEMDPSLSVDIKGYVDRIENMRPSTPPEALQKLQNEMAECLLDRLGGDIRDEFDKALAEKDPQAKQNKLAELICSPKGYLFCHGSEAKGSKGYNYNKLINETLSNLPKYTPTYDLIHSQQFSIFPLPT